MHTTRILYQKLFAGGAVLAFVLAVGSALAEHGGADLASAALPPAPTAAPRPTAAPPPQAPAQRSSAVRRPMLLEGVRAIQPGSPTTDPDKPAFSAQDAIDHVSRHGFRSKVEQGGAPVVEKVEFLKGRSVAARLHLAPDSLGDRLLCVVTLRGAFSVAGPVDVRDREAARVVKGDTVVLVFDAHTGNQLVVQMPHN